MKPPQEQRLKSEAQSAYGRPGDRWGILRTSIGEWHTPHQWSLTAPDEVHVVKAFLDVSGEQLTSLAATLGTSERERAARFALAVHRNRYIAAHGLLRKIVGGYAGIHPADVELSPSPSGKPSLVGADSRNRVEFNMSHAVDLVLVAVARNHIVGVDCEQIPQAADWENLAGECLSSEENALLRSLPRDQRCPTLYQWWTRKEALAKALGEGLALSFHRWQVIPPFLAPTDEKTPERMDRWNVWDLAPIPGFVGAVVADGSARSLHLLHLRLNGEDVRGE